MSTSIPKALPGKFNIKRHLPSILYFSPSLSMSTSVLKALPGKLDIKRHLPSSLISRQASRCQHAFSKPCLVNLISKDINTKILNTVIITCLKSETLSKLIKRILDSRLLISRLTGSALRMQVGSLCKHCDVNKHSQSLAWLT